MKLELDMEVQVDVLSDMAVKTLIEIETRAAAALTTNSSVTPTLELDVR